MSRESNGLFGTKAAKEERKIFDLEAVQVSDRLYNAIIGAVLLWGFVINILMCKYLSEEFVKWNFLIVIIVYFVSCLIGVSMVHKSENAFVSFLGYNFIVVPIGVVLSVALTQYDPELIFRAVLVTAFVTGVMIIMGTMFPKFFLSIGRTLFIALVAVIVIELLMIFIFRMDSTIIDWIVVIIFCGYIGYDWSLANQYQKTVDNAVDSAADLYLDIINLFLRILRILGRKR